MDIIPAEKISEILDRTNIVDLISNYVHLTKKGNSYFGLCPFHSEKTPSFSVSPNKQLYYCFGCGAKGNAITFLMEKDGLNFVEAVKELASKSGVELLFSKSEKKKYLYTDKLVTIMQNASEFFQKNIDSNSGIEGKKYILKRGLTQDALKKWGIGFASDNWDNLKNFLTNKGFQLNDLETVGLISSANGKSFDKFRNRIIFPIKDHRGRTVAFGGRAITDDNNPKYLNSPETPIFKKGELLYGIDSASSEMIKQKSVFLVEGYLDVISLWEKGIKNAVAPLGTGLTEKQVDILSRFADRVYLTFDGDSAGQKATLRAISILMKKGLENFVMGLPETDDPDSFIKNQGIEKWNNLINSAKNGFTYMIDKLSARYGLSPEGKLKTVNQLIEILNSFDNDILKATYIKELAYQLNIDEQQIAAKVNKETYTKSSTNSREQLKFEFYPEEEILLSLLLKKPTLLKNDSIVKLGNFIISPLLLNLFNKLKDMKDIENFKLSHIFEYEDKRLNELIIFLDNIKVIDEELTGEFILRLEERKLKIAQKIISGKIKEAEKKGDYQEELKLLKEKQNLLGHLKNLKENVSGGSYDKEKRN